MFEKISQQGQAPLFIEDIYDALRAAVMYLGGPKAVSAKLWPAKPIDQARTALLDCLNRDNGRKFDAEEILAILRLAREAGFHAAKHWLDEALGYQPTLPADPVVERDRLAEEFARAADNFMRLQRTAERLLEPRMVNKAA